MHQFETPQKFYQYLSSKKLINNFPKIDKLKKKVTSEGLAKNIKFIILKINTLNEIV